MLGSVFVEKENKHKEEAGSRYNDKLIKAYKRTCDNYHAACERCERLEEILKRLKMEKTLGEEFERISDDPSCTEVMMEQMICEAHREKTIIASQAMEYIKHLRSLKYEM